MNRFDCLELNDTFYKLLKLYTNNVIEYIISASSKANVLCLNYMKKEIGLFEGKRKTPVNTGIFLFIHIHS